MAKEQGTSKKAGISEPGESINVETIEVEEIKDPLTQSGTIDRDYAKSGGGTYTGEIPEPPITAPMFEEEDFGSFDNQGTANKSFSSEGPKPGAIKPASKEEDDDDDYGFELNGETFMMLIDVLYNIFKNQYKITETNLEQKGFSPMILEYPIVYDGHEMKLGTFAEMVNQEIDNCNIEAKDRKLIVKTVTKISKKHDIKVSPEVQLLLIMGKIGFETHIKLTMLQAEIMGRMDDITAGRAPNQHHAPDLSDIEEMINSNKVPDPPKSEQPPIDPDEVQSSVVQDQDPPRKTKKKRGPYKTKKRMEAEQNAGNMTTFKEPGEN